MTHNGMFIKILGFYIYGPQLFGAVLHQEIETFKCSKKVHTRSTMKEKKQFQEEENKPHLPSCL